MGAPDGSSRYLAPTIALSPIPPNQTQRELRGGFDFPREFGLLTLQPRAAELHRQLAVEHAHAVAIQKHRPAVRPSRAALVAALERDRQRRVEALERMLELL